MTSPKNWTMKDGSRTKSKDCTALVIWYEWMTSIYYNKHCTGRLQDSGDDQVGQGQTGNTQSRQTQPGRGKGSSSRQTSGIRVQQNMSALMRAELKSRGFTTDHAMGQETQKMEGTEQGKGHSISSPQELMVTDYKVYSMCFCTSNTDKLYLHTFT